MSRILALIPARGGSKGIPRKNLAPLGGRPLLAWTIEQARATPEVDRVVVSTDDSEIAEVAREWGAEVVERPVAIAGDEASSESALLHALDALAEEGWEPELVVFLQATSPLRRRDEISRALATFRRDGADSLFSASTVHGDVRRGKFERSTENFLSKIGPVLGRVGECFVLLQPTEINSTDHEERAECGLRQITNRLLCGPSVSP